MDPLLGGTGGFLGHGKMLCRPGTGTAGKDRLGRPGRPFPSGRFCWGSRGLGRTGAGGKTAGSQKSLGSREKRGSPGCLRCCPGTGKRRSCLSGWPALSGTGAGRSGRMGFCRSCRAGRTGSRLAGVPDAEGSQAGTEPGLPETGSGGGQESGNRREVYRSHRLVPEACGRKRRDSLSPSGLDGQPGRGRGKRCRKSRGMVREGRGIRL